MKKYILFVILALVLGGIFFWSEIADFYSRLTFRLPQIEVREKVVLVEEIGKQIIAPAPLRAVEETPKSFLTQAGIIKWTNSQRKEYDLPPLRENSELNALALIKAKDMLAEQYFGHISPAGEGVADLAEMIGYEFIIIGENLALGNFRDDQALVQGWMDSPGHRQNILNGQY